MLFHDIRLLLCIYKEGTVIQEDVVPGERNNIESREQCTSKIPDPDGGEVRTGVCHQVWDISLEMSIRISETTIGD